MLHSCSQRPVLGGKALSPAFHFTCSRSHHQLLMGGTGTCPEVYFSRAVCFGFSPLPSSASQHGYLQQRNVVVAASLKKSSGKGFGKKNVELKKKPSSESSETTSISTRSPADQEEVPSKSQFRVEEEEDDEDVVPEVVTNRMLKRIALTVGLPVGLGILFFPLFYYLKIVSKVDVPEWLPLMASMVTFGTAGLGISYGIVSSSWDPEREGSLLGWKEAQVNWPLIWEKVRGNQTKK